MGGNLLSQSWQMEKALHWKIAKPTKANVQSMDG